MSLSSFTINKEKLISVEQVIKKYPKLKTEGKAGTLACKIAREALFGVEVMKKCTLIGSRELPGLPVKELAQLKKAMFHSIGKLLSSLKEFGSGALRLFNRHVSD